MSGSASVEFVRPLSPTDLTGPQRMGPAMPRAHENYLSNAAEEEMRTAIASPQMPSRGLQRDEFSSSTGVTGVEITHTGPEQQLPVVKISTQTETYFYFPTGTAASDGSFVAEQVRTASGEIRAVGSLAAFGQDIKFKGTQALKDMLALQPLADTDPAKAQEMASRGQEGFTRPGYSGVYELREKQGEIIVIYHGGTHLASGKSCAPQIMEGLSWNINPNSYQNRLHQTQPALSNSTISQGGNPSASDEQLAQLEANAGVAASLLDDMLNAYSAGNPAKEQLAAALIARLRETNERISPVLVAGFEREAPSYEKLLAAASASGLEVFYEANGVVLPEITDRTKASVEAAIMGYSADPSGKKLGQFTAYDFYDAVYNWVKAVTEVKRVSTTEAS